MVVKPTRAATPTWLPLSLWHAGLTTNSKTAVHLNAQNVSAQRDLIAFMANAPGNLGGGEDRALEQIHALSAVDPVEGELALADLYAVKKKFEQAGDEYQKILKSAPGIIDAYLEVADYYRDRGEAEQMEQAVERRGQYRAFRSPDELLPRRRPGVREERSSRC